VAWVPLVVAGAQGRAAHPADHPAAASYHQQPPAASSAAAAAAADGVRPSARCHAPSALLNPAASCHRGQNQHGVVRESLPAAAAAAVAPSRAVRTACVCWGPFQQQVVLQAPPCWQSVAPLLLLLLLPSGLPWVLVLAPCHHQGQSQSPGQTDRQQHIDECAADEATGTAGTLL